MQKSTVLMLASLLAVAPLALAHNTLPGTPKPYCEDWYGPGEVAIHDYAPPATGSYLAPPTDGNLEDCNWDGTLADHDGHDEWAMGGAWLSVNTWEDPWYGGGGSLYCHGEVGHHPAFPTVSVTDLVVGASAPFRVSADYLDFYPPLFGGPSCGDFEDELWQDCIGSCVVTFPPGLDGSYHVCVNGFLGHVVTDVGGTAPPMWQPPVVAADPIASPTTGTFCGPVTGPIPNVWDLIPDVDYPQCTDGYDNDNDGSVDWINDAECNSPIDDTEQS